MREDEEARLLSWGLFLLLLLVLDLCYALGEGGVTTITDGRKIGEGVCPPYIGERRRMTTIVVGVASPSFPCARHFGAMHSGTKGGAIITNGRMYTPRKLRVFKKKTRQTDSHPVMNDNDLI